MDHDLTCRITASTSCMQGSTQPLLEKVNLYKAQQGSGYQPQCTLPSSLSSAQRHGCIQLGSITPPQGSKGGAKLSCFPLQPKA